ncbi:MAG: hypothetical protein EA350_15260 [Gemmatimonadales bacterium]|nr:MAG: hypothetical protein EA350_15260 [Gemmatimonadales bacterium]
MDPFRKRFASWRTLLAAIAGAWLVPVGALEAQDAPAAERNQVTVTGRVVDAFSGTPLPAVRVRLVPAADTVVAPAADPAAPPPTDPDPDPGATLREREALTDAEGRFTMPAVRIANYRLAAEALGYATLESPVRVMGASPFDIRIELAPEALALEGVVVTSVRSPRLAAAGFYERRERAFGSFVTRSEIEARFPFATTDLFRTLPGVRVVPSGRSTAGIVTFRQGCRPDVVVDGMNLGPNLSVDDIIAPSDVEAIEVYRGAVAPVHYSRSSCGVIVIWSADPATRAGDRPFSWRRLFAAAAFVALALLATR